MKRGAEHVAVMTIDGAEVPSSAVAVGSRAKCEAAAGRLNRQRDRHPSVRWVVREVAA